MNTEPGRKYVDRLFEIFRTLRANYSYLGLVFFTAIAPVTISTFLLVYLETLETFLFSKWGSLLFFCAATLTMAFAVTPTTFIAILTGYLLGWKGLPGVVISYGLASLIGLKTGQLIHTYFTGSPLFQSEKYNKLISRLADDQLRMLIFSWLSPVLPFAMTNLVLGQLKLNHGKYLVGTIIGMLPRTLFSLFIGTQAKEIWVLLSEPSSSNEGKIITLVLLLVSTIGLYLIFSRAWKRVA